MICPLLPSMDFHCHICYYSKPLNIALNKKCLLQGEKKIKVWVDGHGIFLFLPCTLLPYSRWPIENSVIATVGRQHCKIRLVSYTGCSNLVNNIWYSFSVNTIPGVEWQLSLLPLRFSCKYFISQSLGFGLCWFKVKIRWHKGKLPPLGYITMGPFTWLLRQSPGYWAPHATRSTGKKMSLCYQIHSDFQGGNKVGIL